MDAFQKDVIERLTRIETTVAGAAKLPERVTALELAGARQSGKASVIGFLVSAVTAGVVAWTSKHFA